ncbi:MAG: hypothetical protein INQ03_05765 [Candidatus Heimdallarchaeota archaeon]|nr:hypothetical protein [Candidatus Heimdallarchaeota archaeon]
MLVLPIQPTESVINLTFSLDTETYYGYELGATGIVSSLIDVLYNNLLPSRYDDILDLVTTTLQRIWDDRIEINGSKRACWCSAPDSGEIYPGIKYGSAGILQVFLELYELTLNRIWLERAEEIYSNLASLAFNNSTYPHWSLTYDDDNEGNSVTNIKYGSAGILEQALKLYRLTQNLNYLEHAEGIINWMRFVSINYEVKGNNYSVIPWFYNLNNEGQVKFGANWGISGMAPLLYEFGVLTANETMMNWSREIMEYLILYQQEDGSWYLDNEDGTIKTDYDEGMAGIIANLYKMQLLIGEEVYQPVILKALDFLFSQKIHNSTLIGFVAGNKNNQVYYGYLSGLIGILSSLRQVYTLLTYDQSVFLTEAYNWIINEVCFIREKNGVSMRFIRKSANTGTNILDFSLADGAAGLLKEIASLANDDFVLIEKNILINAIDQLVNSFKYCKAPNNLWNKEKSVSSCMMINTMESHTVISEENYQRYIILVPYTVLLIYILFPGKRKRKEL